MQLVQHIVSSRSYRHDALQGGPAVSVSGDQRPVGKIERYRPVLGVFADETLALVAHCASSCQFNAHDQLI